MKLLIVLRSGDRATPVKKTVTTEFVRVGRNASCEIHLPDPRIALEQGMLVHRDGLVYLEGEGPSGKSTTRKSVRSRRLEPGEPLELGPYRLEAIAAPAGIDAAISVERVRTDEPATNARRAWRLTLASAGLSRRWTAWALFAAVLVAFLAIPAGRVLDLPWKDATRHPVVGDRSWSPGRLMLAHQPIESRCESCHEVAFEHVRDRACLECHASIGHHVAPGLQPAALFAGARCTSCHRDHKGTKATHRDDDTFCVDCHRDVRTRAPESVSQDVRDFGATHPEFRVTVARDGKLVRIRQGSQPLAEPTALAFPHALHLDAKGVRSPQQGRIRLQCKSCHQPDALQRGFERVTMAKHCQECHALQFEPAVSAREVPHGKPAEALTTIEEFYANLALNGVRDSFQKAFGVPGEGLLRRVGDPGEAERHRALAMARAKAGRVAAELFEVRVCSTCHTVRRGKDEWTIAPSPTQHAWMPRASFDHKSHLHVKCADCHAVAGSKRAADVAMPGIAQCRKCHSGAQPAEGKVRSSCLLCHGFHESGHAWDPSFRPRRAGNVAGSPRDGR